MVMELIRLNRHEVDQFIMTTAKTRFAGEEREFYIQRTVRNVFNERW